MGLEIILMYVFISIFVIISGLESIAETKYKCRCLECHKSREKANEDRQGILEKIFKKNKETAHETKATDNPA